jgi:hypothetical protein
MKCQFCGRVVYDSPIFKIWGNHRTKKKGDILVETNKKLVSVCFDCFDLIGVMIHTMMPRILKEIGFSLESNPKNLS